MFDPNPNDIFKVPLDFKKIAPFTSDQIFTQL